MMRTITVRGVGNVSARPDYITISMTIESIRKDYDGAMRDASERISKLQDVAVRSGYAKEDLKTTSFNVDTRYESVKDRQGNYKREFAGYACVQGYEYHDLYDEYVYEISGYKRYQVTEVFPRLTTKDVAPSIKKASYEISLTDLVSFEVV